MGNLKNYFRFNKKERNGILLLSFILMVTIVYYNSMHLFQDKTKTDFSEFESLIPVVEEKLYESKKDSLFVFNPNTLDDEGWILLGLSSKQLSIFRNYQKSGVVFYNKEELKKCFAISEEFTDKVSDFITFPEKEIFSKKEFNQEEIKKKNDVLIIVELNSADSITLISINGIGPFYAKQIIKYRNDLGGFLSYSQFSEIWGLEKLDLNKIKLQTTLDTTLIQKININSSTVDELRMHPYFRYKQANTIINYRSQHGNFKEIKDIQKIVLIDSQLFRKIAPYLKIHD
jgi:competence protein ComEA